MRERILITGAAGNVGQHVVPLLRAEFALRLLDAKPLPAEGDDEVVQADIRDFEAMRQACVGVKTLVHLAAVPTEDDFATRLMSVNVLGVQTTFEAARQAGVRKIVFASTGQIVGAYPRDLHVTPDMLPRPLGQYACTKLFGEAMARLYSDRYGMSMICLRIGWFMPPDSPNLRLNPAVRRIWCSPRDLAQLITRSIHATVPFAIFFAVSNNANQVWDLSNAQQLVGYEPQDNSANYVGR